MLEVVGEEDLVAEQLQPTLDFHRKVTYKGVVHVARVADNTLNTHWPATHILSKSSASAHATSNRPCTTQYIYNTRLPDPS